MGIPKKEIESLYAAGLTLQKIGDKYGVSRQRIHQILTGYTTNPRHLFKRKLRKSIDYCQVCGKVKAKLQIHHVDEKVYNNEPDNLLVVCVKCHNQFHLNSRKRWNGLVAEIKTTKCLNCQKEFTFKGYQRRFCSRKCRADYALIELKCAYCHKLFKRRRSEIFRKENKSRQIEHTCSHSCRSRLWWSRQ